MSSQSIIATRMALLATKKKITLATKGHKLLKEKRDALIGEFFAIVDKVKKLREQVETELEGAFKSLILAEAVNGIGEVRRAASVAQPVAPITRSSKTIMGLKVPLFTFEGKPMKVTGRGYSLVTTSVELDYAAQHFERVLTTLISVAEMEAAVEALAQDIKKTKRKVNALEQILIPRLEEERDYITMRLEEMDRETFGRLKIIKANITK